MNKVLAPKASIMKNIISIMFLVAYVFTVTTLDYHHNHSCCHEDYPGTVLKDHHPNEHDPCPVLVLTQAHAPVLSLVYEPEITSVDAFDPYLDHLILVLCPSADSRGPPDLS